MSSLPFAPAQAVVEGHRAASLVEEAVENVLPGSDVVVHVEPRRSGLELRDRVLAIALAEPLVRETHDVTIFEQEGSLSVSLHLKFPADLDLRTAHAVAERVEQAIRSRPRVADVQTHLEPLELPLRAHPAEDRAERQALEEIRRLVSQRADIELHSLRLLFTEAGRVVFLTVEVGSAASLVDAHRSQASSRTSCAGSLRTSPTSSCTPSHRAPANEDASGHPGVHSFDRHSGWITTVGRHEGCRSARVWSSTGR